MSARDAFVVKDVILDTNGASHVRMDRLYAGLPVIGGDLVMHMSASGAFANASTTMTSSLSLATKPKASSGSAIRAANAAFAGITSGQPSSVLSVYTRNGVTALAYDVLVRGTAASGRPSETHVIVDANTLAVLDKFDDIKTTAAAGTGNSLTSGVVPLTTDQTGATTFVLRDPTRGNHYINDLAGRRSGNGTTYTDSDNLWGNSSTSNSQTAAVDAMYGQNTTWDFYQSLGRNGINGTGGAGYSRVHYSRNYVNAYWSDSCFCMTYGDGDGATYLPLVALDVAGHEMTHGVTSTSAGLVYSGQSGGLNESMSDIMGTMVEFRGTKGNNLPNYLIGERIYTANNNVPTPTTALRYMFKPSLDGASP
ncbi:MAG: M4 family metallopeptidase, partial [Nevskia sp.]|nr:M4 family metallopeptidase [Nevskia sp.]